MIAGTDEDMRLLAQQLHILLDDDGLRPALHQRAEVKMIARQDHQVEAIGFVHHPVKLRQRVVQIGDDEASHGEPAAVPDEP